MFAKTNKLTIVIAALFIITIINYGHCKDASVLKSSSDMRSLEETTTRLLEDDDHDDHESHEEHAEHDEHEEGEEHKEDEHEGEEDHDEEHGDEDHDDHDEHKEEGLFKKDRMDNAWYWTFGAVGFIACCNVILASLVGPHFKDKKTGKYNKSMKSVLNVIIAIAVGALVGDALIHIIPHSFETAELLAAEAKGIKDPHAGHDDHRMLTDTRFLEEDDHDDHDDHAGETAAEHALHEAEEAEKHAEEEGEGGHDHSAGIRVGIWVCAGIFG
jgi:hypothetical protein